MLIPFKEKHPQMKISILSLHIFNMFRNFFTRPKSDAERYPELKNFIRCYFHQDYDVCEEYDDEDEIMYSNIVKSLCSEENKEYIRKLIEEINAITNDGIEITEDRLRRLGREFCPEDETQTPRAFLLHLRDLFIQHGPSS